MRPRGWMQVESGAPIPDSTSPSGYRIPVRLTVNTRHPGFWWFAFKAWWRSRRQEA